MAVPSTREARPRELLLTARTVLGRTARVFFVASLAGVVALVLESLARIEGQGRFAQVHASSVALYALAAGLYGVAVAGLCSLLGSVQWRRAIVVGSLSLLAAPGLLYRVHTQVLPGDPWHSQRSLAATAFVAAVVATFGAAMGWVARVRGEHPVLRRAATVLGATAFPLAVGTVWTSFPHDRPLPQRQSPGPDVVLIVLDAVRRDHLSLYGYGRDTSPQLVKWARTSRVYTHALSPSSWTVASMERVLWPQAGEPSLAERLRGRGYVTAAFTDNPHLRADAPLMQGFDRVSTSYRPWRALLRNTVMGAALARIRPVSDVLLLREVSAFLDSGIPGPFFLYVHLMDAHAPYRFAPLDGVRHARRWIEFPDDRQQITAAEKLDIVNRYDAGVAKVDRHLDRILQQLEASGRPYIAVVMADHGESLGEEGRWTHGKSLAPELIRVPLLVRGIGVTPGLVEGLTAAEDGASTLLAAAGLEPVARAADLRRSNGVEAVMGALPPRLAYRVTAAGLKVETDLERQTTHVFDWASDPDERHDLAASTPLDAQLFTGLVAATRPRLDHGGSPTLAPEVRERLKSLGYAAP